MTNTKRNHTTNAGTWRRMRDAYGPGYQACTDFDRAVRTVAAQVRYPS